MVLVCSFFAFFIACAKVYLRYTSPQFLSKASVYLNGSIRKSNGFVGLNDLQNMGTGTSKNSMEYEIALMKSKPIILQTVKNLNLDTKVFVEGKVKKVEFYDDSPIQAKILKINNPDFGGETYEISPKDDFSFYLKKRENGSKKSYFFNIPINLGFGEVILNKKNNLIFDSSYNISFLNAKNIANQIEGSISIFSKEDSNILELNRTGEIPKMSEDILDELIKVYNDDAVKDKKFEASNSAEFIKDRLKIITAELANIEGKKTSYKKANNIFDIENQAQVSISGLDQGTQKSLELNAQLELVNSVLAIVNAKNEQLLPTNLGIPNAADGLMNQYNELILLRNKTLRQATPANPVIIQFNKEISQLKNLIKDNLLKSKDLLSQNLSYQQSKISQYKNEMTMFPEQENFFKNIDRQQKIKESLYLYLLQKNEEISMALAVTTPKVKVLNPAFTTSVMTPNVSKIMMYAYGLGFFLPTSWKRTDCCNEQGAAPVRETALHKAAGFLMPELALFCLSVVCNLSRLPPPAQRQVSYPPQPPLPPADRTHLLCRTRPFRSIRTQTLQRPQIRKVSRFAPMGPHPAAQPGKTDPQFYFSIHRLSRR